MTLHIGTEDHVCPHCNVVFIPFGICPVCPNCARENPASNEYRAFISTCARSLYVNRLRYGRYRPDGWGTRNYSDEIHSYLFRIFDLIERDRPVDVQRYVEHEWKYALWKPYQYRHILDIFLLIYPELAQPPSNWRERWMKLTGRWHGDKLPPLAPPPAVHIPAQYVAWHGKQVVATRGPNGTVSVLDTTSAELRRKALAANTKMDFKKGSAEDFASFVLLGSFEVTIGNTGELLLPRGLVPGAGHDTVFDVRQGVYGLEVRRTDKRWND